MISQPSSRPVVCVWHVFHCCVWCNHCACDRIWVWIVSWLSRLHINPKPASHLCETAVWHPDVCAHIPSYSGFPSQIAFLALCNMWNDPCCVCLKCNEISLMNAYGSNEPKITRITLVTHNISCYVRPSMHVKCACAQKEFKLTISEGPVNCVYCMCVPGKSKLVCLTLVVVVWWSKQLTGGREMPCVLLRARIICILYESDQR